MLVWANVGCANSDKKKKTTTPKKKQTTSKAKQCPTIISMSLNTGPYYKLLSALPKLKKKLV